jgi:hypothetical protein
VKNISKGNRTHHQNHGEMAGGGGDPDGGIGGHNDGHGIYASGGPVLHEGNDKHYKDGPTRSDRGQFLSKTDRFTGGRMPLDYPKEAETEEDWSKPRGVGHTEEDDAGDCKTLPPVKPNKAGNVWYGKGARQTTTDTWHEDHEPKAD